MNYPNFEARMQAILFAKAQGDARRDPLDDIVSVSVNAISLAPDGTLFVQSDEGRRVDTGFGLTFFENRWLSTLDADVTRAAALDGEPVCSRIFCEDTWDSFTSHTLLPEGDGGVTLLWGAFRGLSGPALRSARYDADGAQTVRDTSLSTPESPAITLRIADAERLADGRTAVFTEQGQDFSGQVSARSFTLIGTDGTATTHAFGGAGLSVPELVSAARGDGLVLATQGAQGVTLDSFDPDTLARVPLATVDLAQGAYWLSDILPAGDGYALIGFAAQGNDPLIRFIDGDGTPLGDTQQLDARPGPVAFTTSQNGLTVYQTDGRSIFARAVDADSTGAPAALIDAPTGMTIHTLEAAHNGPQTVLSYDARGPDGSAQSFLLSLDADRLLPIVGGGNQTATDAAAVLRGTDGADALTGGAGNDILLGDTRLPLSAQRTESAEALVKAAGQIDAAFGTTLFDTPLYTSGAGQGPDAVTAIVTDMATRLIENAGLRQLGGAETVDRIFNALLGRDAPDVFQSTFAQIVGEVDALGAFIQSLAGSPEYRATLNADPGALLTQTVSEDAAEAVYWTYRAALGREPDLAGLSHWAGRLSAEEIDLPDMHRAILLSPEARARFEGVDASATVDLFFRAILDRPAAPAAQDFFGQSLMRAADMPLGARDVALLTALSASQEATALRDAARDTDLAGWMRAQAQGDQIAPGGGSDIIAGGYLADHFIFNAGDGGDHTLLDLRSWDTLVFHGFGYDSAEDVRAHLSIEGADLQFADQGLTLTISGGAEGTITDEMLML
ncbi:DUF4214 domain-containing protein [Sulfitobacter sp. S190]|uniref:DUF4214 domain-containing protein n=1 Tax=Sulfitobacter sp. S190 TaxID=2867022 RepID=UPI0021A29499|nr:DUF4214 domain-containing protein [Sulfitobacter sp. S190]UWR23426.1 DUF4214 domain-containing protein [Sulfitobacter sp. S190]